MADFEMEKKMLFDTLLKFHKLLLQKAPRVDLSAAAKSILEGRMRPFLRNNWQAEFLRTGELFTAGFFRAHSGFDLKDVNRIDLKDVNRRKLLTSVAEGLVNLWLDPDWSKEDDGPGLKRAIRRYLKLNGVIFAQVQSPEAQSDSVALFGQGKEPIVDGKRKKPLTRAGYNVIYALIEADERGLTKDTLVTASGHTDARGVLKRIIGARTNRDVDWDNVISFPGKTGGRYRVL